uniref:GIY-YIG domain-containing protein n=1 Tax=Chrysemys picta bellii TaxID=8478 RepID=A0A8C3HVR0_CHRPI
MYIGQTRQSLRKRINGHKSDIRNHNTQKPVGEHFNLSGHSMSDLHTKSFSFLLVREQLKELTKQYEKSENDLKALQSVGQIVGEVLKQLTEEKFIVKATNGPRYVVGCRRQVTLLCGSLLMRSEYISHKINPLLK